jgi:molybdenum cofactor guanylyltransferase
MSVTNGSKISPTAVIAGYVMAGGASERFGFDKARAELGGKTMLARMSALVEEVTGSVSVVAPARRYDQFDMWVVEDLWPGQGPLGGIITALTATAETDGGREWNLIVGCDMPFLTPQWLTHLVARALASEAQVVTPRSKQGLEPLCACWRTSAVRQLQHAFDDGARKVTEGMKHLAMEVLDEADWKRFDSGGRLFWNMNTPVEYDEAKRILKAEPT